MALSPLMKQYLEVKQEHPDCILMCRIGDFYEMFFEDAKTASRELDLVLTGKDCGLEERAPMCGVPHHAADGYIAKLVSRGYRVAICEQVSDPKASQGLVKREVTRVVTPGTITDSGLLNESKNNYLASVALGVSVTGLAFIDVSTGEVAVTHLDNDSLEGLLINEMSVFRPSEAIFSAPFTTCRNTSVESNALSPWIWRKPVQPIIALDDIEELLLSRLDCTSRVSTFLRFASA
jgi:DNA mismatch repair protein MutS